MIIILCVRSVEEPFEAAISDQVDRLSYCQLENSSLIIVKIMRAIVLCCSLFQKKTRPSFENQNGILSRSKEGPHHL